MTITQSRSKSGGYAKNATNNGIGKTNQSTSNPMFIDYSTLLMDMEKKIKDLEDKCLHKRYSGYLADIVSIHSNLSMLAVWIAEQQIKEKRNEPPSL